MIYPFPWLRDPVNRLLRPFNLRMDTLTAEDVERRRVHALRDRGYFDGPRFPVPSGFGSEAYQNVFADLPGHHKRFDTFCDPAANDVDYTYNNGFFTSPDAEVLYTLLMAHRPRRVVEIGCGNSTRIIRQAIRDGGWPCRLTCIDPRPRADVVALADELRLSPIEHQDEGEIAGSLGTGDCLFIDTSHVVRPSGDLAFLYLRLLPRIAPGVLVHIHDVFLPYDYPLSFVNMDGRDWGEQYLVQLLLTACPSRYEVLWPGYYLQRSLTDFGCHFPHRKDRSAQSLWLRTSPSGNSFPQAGVVRPEA